MKKTILYTLLVLVGLGLFSCKKDSTPQPATTNNNTTTTKDTNHYFWFTISNTAISGYSNFAIDVEYDTNVNGDSYLAGLYTNDTIPALIYKNPSATPSTYCRFNKKWVLRHGDVVFAECTVGSSFYIYIDGVKVDSSTYIGGGTSKIQHTYK